MLPLSLSPVCLCLIFLSLISPVLLPHIQPCMDDTWTKYTHWPYSTPTYLLMALTFTIRKKYKYCYSNTFLPFTRRGKMLLFFSQISIARATLVDSNP